MTFFHSCYSKILIPDTFNWHMDGKTLKLKLAYGRYIQECEGVTDDIYHEISECISELRGCYDAESTKYYKNHALTTMMLVDGCALLCYIASVCLGYRNKYFNIKYQDIGLLHHDVLLLAKPTSLSITP